MSILSYWCHVSLLLTIQMTNYVVGSSYHRRSKSRHITPLSLNRYTEGKWSSSIHQVSKELQHSTMSRMLLHCYCGCRTTFVVCLTTLFEDQGRTFTSMNRPHQRAAHAVGMTVVEVKHIVRSSNTSSPSTPATQSSPTVFGNYTVDAIRRYIHRKFTDKHHLTLSTLATELMTEDIIPEQTSHTAVYRLIHTWDSKIKCLSVDCISKRKPKISYFAWLIHSRLSSAPGTKTRKLFT